MHALLFVSWIVGGLENATELKEKRFNCQMGNVNFWWSCGEHRSGLTRKQMVRSSKNHARPLIQSYKRYSTARSKPRPYCGCIIWWTGHDLWSRLFDYKRGYTPNNTWAGVYSTLLLVRRAPATPWPNVRLRLPVIITPARGYTCRRPPQPLIYPNPYKFAC